MFLCYPSIMDNKTVRTTIDLSKPLLTLVKHRALEKGETVKKVITDAIKRHVISQAKPSAKELIAEFRRLSKFGRQDVDLVEFIRRDRDTHF